VFLFGGTKTADVSLFCKFVMPLSSGIGPGKIVRLAQGQEWQPAQSAPLWLPA